MNCIIRAEGILLYNDWEDSDMDSWPYGEWLFYDETGVLKDKRLFQ